MAGDPPRHLALGMALAALLMCVPETLAQPCTRAERDRIAVDLPRLTSWSRVHDSFRAYAPRCDGGWMAEGLTDAVVTLLAPA